MDRLQVMETFVRIARAGSMARAAKQLGLSRATVSTHLSQLESHLGARLFNRTTRQLVLTSIGMEYLTFASRVLAEIDEMEFAVAEQQVQPRGLIKIACPLILGHYLLSHIVADFIQIYPEITAAITLYDARQPLMNILDHGFDVAIQLGHVNDMSIISRNMGAVRYIVCAARSYVAAHGAPERPEDLVRHNCLVHQIRTPDSVWSILQDEKLLKVKVAGSMLGNSDSVLLAGVCSGLGIGILPKYCIAPYLEDGTIVQILPDCQIPPREITALMPHTRHIPNKTRILLDYVSSRLGQV